MSVLQLRSLTSVERDAVAAAQKAADHKALLAIKHMAERHIEIEGKAGTALWLFYLPDFTHLFKDWYSQYIEQVRAIYDTTASGEIVFDREYLLLKYRGRRPRNVVGAWLRDGSYHVLEQLTARASEAETVCNAEISRVEALHRRQCELPLADMVAAVSHFAGFGLDHAFPFELFSQRFPQINSTELFTSPISSWDLLYQRALDAAEQVFVNERSYGEAVRSYADHTSYLRWGDICSREDDISYARMMVSHALQTFPNFASLWRYRQEQRDARRISRASQCHAVRTSVSPLRKIERGDHRLFRELSRFAAISQRYNEMRRILFTRTLRLLRDVCETYEQDWRTTSLAELTRTTASPKSFANERR
ncbi:MAG: hypothetical protein A3A33_04155 [Candidatus Yanofskybacteria bacterium RIFCSPLOWO2_01_FULL_49_25]|uniref:Uncharacterized protein n=1 Tax=Candidatus Yanofskybacteria bacterium RIFCSPLOWO2_01_FULL_49_25 TaxID=1802701 RepID=A0A1F8GRP9_9BACT|nr:MAG: hypothetical protein A3A33_04155 [Candidatus Yanofskybacteria bacterium RIFCSPLOWO2_01_FULL_49_25]